jgi:hypothetical protein
MPVDGLKGFPEGGAAMNCCEMLERQHILKICGFAASGILISYVFTASVFAQTPPTPKYQFIHVWNHGGFVVAAQPHWKCSDGKEGTLSWSSKFPVGQDHKWDMAEGKEKITTGCQIWAHMDIAGNLKDDPDSPTVQYAPNGHTVTFDVKGTIFKNWVDKK